MTGQQTAATTPSNYVKNAIRTECQYTPELIERISDAARPLHAVIGLQTEVGELADAFKRHVFYGKPLDETNVKEELGDLLWYIAILTDWYGMDLAEVMERNIAKLRARYPEKFTEGHAVERDLAAERAVLEGCG